jgi:hypothetical protein
LAYTGEQLARVCDTIAALWKQPNMGVTCAQMVERTGSTRNAVAAHLKALRAAGLVYRRRMLKGSGREYLYYWQPLIFYCEDEE